MAIDPLIVDEVRREALEDALWRARLECASPGERERMLAENRRQALSILSRPPSGTSMTDDEWDAWLADFDAEDSDPELMQLLRAAQEDADREVERRRRAGTLLAG